MFCTKCGSQLEDGALFCTSCGAPTNDAEQGAPVMMGAIPTGQAQTQMPPQGAMPQQAYGSAPQAPYGSPQAPVPGAPAGMGAAPQQNPTRGCLGMAWDDVKGSLGYIKKVLLLALISMVPILNFVTVGYGLRWGAEVVHGRRESLPQKIVTGENFKIGFFAIVISIVFSVVISILSTLFTYIGVAADSSAVQAIGSLVILVLTVFIVPLLYLSMMRIGVFDNLGEGFAVGKLVEAYKKKTGTLFCVSYVPSLISGLIGSAIVLVYSLIVGVIIGGSAAAYSSRLTARNLSNMTPEQFMSMFGGQIAVIVLITLIIMYVFMVISMLFDLVATRGVGHYIARFVPEWGAEAQAKGMNLTAPMGQQPMGQSPVGQPGQPPMGQPMGPRGQYGQPMNQPMSQSSGQLQQNQYSGAPMQPAQGFGEPFATPSAAQSSVAPMAGAAVAGAAAAGAAGVGAFGTAQPESGFVSAQLQEQEPASAPEPQPEPAPSVVETTSADTAAVGAATASAAQASSYFDDRYYDDYSETSVLPEMPDYMDTVVQAEELTGTMDEFLTGGAHAARPRHASSSHVVETPEPAVQPKPVEQPQPAVQTQPMPQPTASQQPAGIVGDDSDTVVFSEAPMTRPIPVEQPPTDRLLTLRVTRANGDTCELASFPVTIGKGSEADLCIPDNSTISRLHVRLHRDGNVFAAEDLGSTNKTCINGYQIAPNTPTILSDGDELKLSNEVLRISIR